MAGKQSLQHSPPLGDRAVFRKKLVAVAVGTILEYYDFAIFGSLVDVIATLYFPSSSELGSFLASMTVFGSAFFMRPLGGLLIGYVGDTWGRRQALELSITLMLLPSFLIGCLPPYSVGGVSVTIVLVLLRLLQGLAVGGEMVGAFIFTIESAAGNRPGLWGSITKSTSLVGNVSGLLVVTFLRHYLTEEEMLTWGWRLPFFIALALALVGLRLRKEIVAIEEEHEAALKAEQGQGGSIDASDRSIVMQGALGTTHSAAPSSSALSVTAFGREEQMWGLRAPEDTFASQWREILLSIAVTSLWSIGYYTCFVWLVYFTDGLMYDGERTVPNAWWLNLGMSFVLIFLFPLGGWLGDIATAHIATVRPDSFQPADGFRAVMMMGAAVMAVSAVPGFFLIETAKQWAVCLAQFVFACALALHGGNMPAYLVYKFPKNARYSSIGVGYNIANGVFAGTAPLVQTYLTVADKVSPSGGLYPSFYLAGFSAFCFLALAVVDPLLRRRRDRIASSRTGGRGGSSSNNTGSLELRSSASSDSNDGIGMDESAKSVTGLMDSKFSRRS